MRCSTVGSTGAFILEVFIIVVQWYSFDWCKSCFMSRRSTPKTKPPTSRPDLSTYAKCGYRKN